LWRRGLVQEAASSFHRALEFQPDNAKTYYYLGDALNLALKGLFDFPRPPEHLHKVSVAHYEPPRSLAFPSGHAQSAGTAWPSGWGRTSTR
jgi:membrane-associated phospholipid phosphatase